jgi:hypothetical protein
MEHKVTSTGIKLIDSWMVSKWDFLWELRAISAKEKDCDVFKNRSIRSLCREWACHNAAYAIGIKRNKTKDCDLNYPMKWYSLATYWIVGWFVWFFIK